MEVRENIVVPLGYGKFVRSDKIVALEPIEDNRGPGRRTHVYVEALKSPLVASRTETAILANIAETPAEIVEATAAFELLQDLLDDIQQVGPMLRKSIKKEAELDLDAIEKKIQEMLTRNFDFNEH
ncbi:hypothetical protein [Clostridium formicaceticum]|uniref:Uncharacterized protein n=1 Tax=Clostridium formicaceticum TaxID=1497 RepID=A0AAC9RL09_9CLOT|nr:hypothetical protein [Clostridium formicaceticum]AOY76794.1 hypothetical protein BJL90_13590 [Clostridium formicaceticum]ARE87258.1 hypothetical protein CLFO_16570 [Clostridium formicaceticum]